MRGKGGYPRIHLRIRKGLPRMISHGHGLRRLRHLFAEAAVHVAFGVKGLIRGIEGGKQGRFPFRHDGKRMQGGCGPLQHVIKQNAQTLAHGTDGILPEQLRAVFQMHLKAVRRCFPEIETEVELARVVRYGHRLHAQRLAVIHGPRCILQRHKHVKERIAGKVSLHPQHINDLFKGV